MKYYSVAEIVSFLAFTQSDNSRVRLRGCVRFNGGNGSSERRDPSRPKLYAEEQSPVSDMGHI
jgi:hypothetical protein